MIILLLILLGCDDNQNSKEIYECDPDTGEVDVSNTQSNKKSKKRSITESIKKIFQEGNNEEKNEEKKERKKTIKDDILDIFKQVLISKVSDSI